ncbi:DNA-processing protein DprA [Mediterranea massiliensis]|uniref:DNA-processing protein DprA n=2 Tax=Mediterranea TaxID=1926659 RepID=UPI0025A327F1|nr:DNA-processing protein DprA [Mediterranea massiliensis]MDM8123907.1 DNA-processing protein DprA [Mediterranea massiliensis]MDM8199671.1 DNA-processing protein DprA [Mediterranea massiliensis]
MTKSGKRTAAKATRELDKAKRILDRQAKAGVITIPYYAVDYPYHFRNLCNDTPPLIHVSGNLELLNRNDTVTIIGARAADAEGLDAAYRFGKQIGGQDHVVISGLALGCDTAAHRGCLDAEGQTIAIVASGLDITHPKVNKTLQEEIVAKGGTIVSEHPFGMKANPTRLVARCRMQVVLTQSVIVVQCPIISGTMYAVRFAQEYSGDKFGLRRQIYAVEYGTMDELNSGNKFLLDCQLALPIKPRQRTELDGFDCLVVN